MFQLMRISLQIQKCMYYGHYYKTFSILSYVTYTWHVSEGEEKLVFHYFQKVGDRSLIYASVVQLFLNCEPDLL